MNDRFEMFTVLISKISKNIRRIKNQEMAEYGLRSAHVSCLYYLYIHEGLTATELCELCEEDKATISRALDCLEDNGFILCKAKHVKRYNSTLHLTETGKEIGQKIADKIGCVLDEICNDLTDDQRIELYRSLAMISNNLELCADGIDKAKKIKNKS